MLLHIPDILTAEQVAHCRQKLDQEARFWFGPESRSHCDVFAPGWEDAPAPLFNHRSR